MSLLKPDEKEKMVRAIRRFRDRLKEMQPLILETLKDKGLITEAEKEQYKDIFLLEYLHVVAFPEECGSPGVYMTTSEHILNRRDELTNTFGLPIKTPEEMMNR